MKIFRKILVALVLLFLIVFIGVTLYLYVSGKQALENILTGALNRPVTIGKLFYDFPLGLRAFHFEVKDILNAKDLKIQFAPETLKGKEVVLSYVSLNAPILKLENKKVVATADMPAGNNPQPSAESQQTQPETAQKVPATVPPSATASSGVETKVVVKKLLVNNGRIVYLGDMLPGGGYVILEQVSLTVNDLIVPTQTIQTKFDGAAQLDMPDNPFNKSRVRLTGWADLMKKDADIKFVLSKSDGKGQFTAKMISKNNLMNVSGEISADNLVFGFTPEAEDEEGIGGLLKSIPLAGLNIGATFSFETQMDRPQIRNISFAGKVMTKE